MVKVSGVPYDVDLPLPQSNGIKYTFETSDAFEARNLMNAQRMNSALWDIVQEIRRIVKYNDLPPECQSKLEELRSFVYSATEGLIGD